MPPSPETPARVTGTIAVIGRPNAGKSTLLNTILGGKLAIVSSKPQTTRDRIVGIHTDERAQFVFTDTPGWHEAWTELNKAMVARAEAALSEADVALWVEDAAYLASRMRRSLPALDEDGLAIAALLERSGKSVIVALNKIDRIEKSAILPMIEALRHTLSWQACVPLSAQTGDGLPELHDALRGALREGPLLYPPEHWTDATERFLAAETIREKVFLLTSKEIPYACAVEIEAFDESRREDDGLCVIRASVIVERPSQKAIVIGKGGAMAKKIGIHARADLETMLDCQVHLELFVKVEPDWTRSATGLRRVGFKD